MENTVIIVTGLPRSGTSMLMQMLTAGGVSILTDDLRSPDEDNPRGYLEFERVKTLLRDSAWLAGEAAGKAVKIVAPLLSGLPSGLPCRIILIERNLDEVLDSQERMLVRRGKAELATPARRKLLRDEFERTIHRVKSAVAGRPDTELLLLDYAETVAHPASTAAKVNEFLGGALDVAEMAAAVDPALHRNRA
jgi:hypothetical protein